MSINEQPYHPWRANSLVWARDLAVLLGVGVNGRGLRPGGGGGGGSSDHGGDIDTETKTHYGSTAETTPTMARELIQPSMNSIRFPCLIL